MASRKNLKKNVNYITETIAGLCIVTTLENQGEKSDNAAKQFMRIMNLRQDIIRRISHTEPGNTKGFYKKLQNDFNTEVQDILQQLGE
ncbi:MAG: hypothetical protein PUD47_01245 [Bacteroidales bacterium]|nr:hypothetical protein [Bacteroidales bacterium]